MENQPEHPRDDRAAVLVSKISGKPIRPLQVSLAALQTWGGPSENVVKAQAERAPPPAQDGS